MAHNLLTDRLPDSITVCGRKYPVHTDFRRWILGIELFAEEFVDVKSKAEGAARILFAGENPLDGIGGRDAEDTAEVYRETVRGIAEFAACGRVLRTAEPAGNPRLSEPVFDFTADAGRIYAAFLQIYGMDLRQLPEKLHFWTFMELLRNLPEETEFMRVVNLRRTDTAKIENDDLRRRLRRAKAEVRIRKEWKGENL